jgi:hypothetical protein
MPEGVVGLADLTLIIQDIARVDINSKTIFFQQPLPAEFDFPTKPKENPWGCASAPYNGTTAYVTAQVMVDHCGLLTSDIPYYRWRVENVGSDAALRSQINAAGIHP